MCDNRQLDDFATGLPGSDSFALRLLPGGGLLVADSEYVLRLDSSGKNIVRQYDVPGENDFFALNLDPDGRSFWSAGLHSKDVYEFDIASGKVLRKFDASVEGPVSLIGGLAVAGETPAARGITAVSRHQLLKNVVSYFKWQAGALGGIIGLLLYLWKLRSSGGTGRATPEPGYERVIPPSVGTQAVLIALSGILATLYLPSVGLENLTVAQILDALTTFRTQRSILLFINYGAFITLVVDEAILPFFVPSGGKSGGHGDASAGPTAAGGAVCFLFLQTAQPDLMLDGFWQVFGTGVFGGVLIEVVLLYRDRRKRSTFPPGYWIKTSMMILCGGALTVFYGVHNVRGLLALQIGASAPLFCEQLLRSPQRNQRSPRSPKPQQ